MKRVAFDIGNVLLHVDLNVFIDSLIERGLYKDHEHAYCFLDGIQAAQDLGLYDIRTAIWKFHPELGYTVRDDLSGKWNGTVYPCDEMIKLLYELRKNNWEIALLSNIGNDHLKEVQKYIPKIIWDYCIHHFSCEVGARKPSKLFFQSFVLQYNWQGELFFDDNDDNVLAATPYFNSIHFSLDNYEDDVEAVKDIKKFFVGDLAIGRA